MDEMMPMATVARVLGCSRATVYRLVTAGKLTPRYAAAKPRTPMFSAEEVASLREPLPKEAVLNVSLHKAVKRRDGGKCVICRETHRLFAHHVVPIEQGGPDTDENLVALCGGCHLSVHGFGVAMKRRAKMNGTLAVAEWLIAKAQGR
jgi:hypothetical protein